MNADIEQDMLKSLREMFDNIQDVMIAINGLNATVEKIRVTVNTQAEVLGCHRYMLEKFMPLPLLEAAATEYAKLRAAAIEQERLASSGIPAATAGN